MQMINVLQRLAELDAGNSNVVNPMNTTELVDMQPMVAESNIPGEVQLPEMPELDIAGLKSLSGVNECGAMMGGMPPAAPVQRPHTPASVNISADSGEELSSMLRDIMTLAGAKGGQDAVPMSAPAVAIEPVGMDEPMDPVGPKQPADSMRSVLDKLNGMDDDDGVSKAQGDLDNDGDHDMDDHDMEKKDKVDEYDNEPNDPNDKNEFDANQFAKQQNTPGQGDRMDGTSPKAYPTMEQVEENLFAEYQRFISEN